MDIDLTKHRVAGVYKSVRCVCGNYNNSSGLHLTRFFSDRDCRLAFENECNFDVRVRM